MFQFRLKDLLLLTTWLSVCLALAKCVPLNRAGWSVAFVGFLCSLAGLLLGRLSKGITLAVAVYALCALLHAVSGVLVGDGKIPVTVEISVVDSCTQQPIEGASVALRDVTREWETLGDVPPLVACATDEGGRSTITFSLEVSVRDGLFARSRTVRSTEGFYLMVARPGYNAQKCNVADRIGKSIAPPRRGPFRINIELDRLAEY